MRLLPGSQVTFTSPMGPIEVHRKLGEVTRQEGTVDTSPVQTAKAQYDGELSHESFHLVNRVHPSYYGWVELVGSVTTLPVSVGGVRVHVQAAMHPRTTNIRFGFWSLWLVILIIMLLGAESIPLSGWFWMLMFAAVLTGMHYLDYRSCLRETEYIRRLLQGSEPE